MEGGVLSNCPIPRSIYDHFMFLDKRRGPCEQHCTGSLVETPAYRALQNRFATCLIVDRVSTWEDLLCVKHSGSRGGMEGPSSHILMKLRAHATRDRTSR